MDNWSKGWRKLVEWDSINKVYLYKGYKIIPLSYSDQIKLPNHLQNEYYWGEISHIDNVIKNKSNKNSNIEGQKEMVCTQSTNQKLLNNLRFIAKML